MAELFSVAFDSGAKKQTQARCSVLSLGGAGGCAAAHPGVCHATGHVQRRLCAGGDVALPAVTGPAAVPGSAAFSAVCSVFIFVRITDLMSPNSIAESVCDCFYALYVLDLLFYMMHVTVKTPRCNSSLHRNTLCAMMCKLVLVE